MMPVIYFTLGLLFIVGWVLLNRTTPNKFIWRLTKVVLMFCCLFNAGYLITTGGSVANTQSRLKNSRYELLKQIDLAQLSTNPQHKYEVEKAISDYNKLLKGAQTARPMKFDAFVYELDSLVVPR